MQIKKSEANPTKERNGFTFFLLYNTPITKVWKVIKYGKKTLVRGITPNADIGVTNNCQPSTDRIIVSNKTIVIIRCPPFSTLTPLDFIIKLIIN